MSPKKRDDWIPRRVEGPVEGQDLIPPGQLPDIPPPPDNAANHTRRIWLENQCEPEDDWVPCSLLDLSNDNDADNDNDSGNDNDSDKELDLCPPPPCHSLVGVGGRSFCIGAGPPDLPLVTIDVGVEKATDVLEVILPPGGAVLVEP